MVLSRSMMLYAIVSAICLLLHNAILIIADQAGAPLILSIAASFCVVAVAGYLLHSWLTFGEALALASFWRYLLAMSINLPMAFVTTWLWRDLVQLPMIYAAPLATLCLVFLNFLTSRWAITASRRTPNSN